jgi:myo-inositol-1(or 4)-monophosphatase
MTTGTGPSAGDAERREVADLAVRVATDAAALLLDRLHLPRDAVTTKSSATDMVSDADRACEALVVDAVRLARPGDGVLGEEGASRAGSSGWRWVVDPLDGTTNYLYRFPAFAVSVAVEHRGETVVGVVVDPSHGDTYVAVRGGGATRNGAPLRASTATDLATALVGTGFSYDPERRRRQAQVLVEVLPSVRDVRRAGAAALDLCWVADGRLDAFYEKGLAPWDKAAGLLVAAEAGAATGDLGDVEGGDDVVVASSPTLFGPLRDMLVRAGAAVA